MSESKRKYAVIRAFMDKHTKEPYAKGSFYESDDQERVKYLQEKGFLSDDSSNVLEDENLIGNENQDEEIDKYHIGGGYYEFPDGEKVRGKEKAAEYLETLNLNNEGE